MNSLRLLPIVIMVCLFSRIYSQETIGTFQQLEKNISELTSLMKDKKSLSNEINILDNEIALLKSSKKLNWFDNRKLAKLTAKKDLENDKILELYNSIIRMKNECYQTYKIYFPRLKQDINDNFEQLEKEFDSTERNQILNKIIEQKRRRDFIVSTQKYYIQIDNETDIIQQDITDIRNNLDEKFIDEMKNIIKDKIYQFDLIINAAKKEKQLKKKLEDFNLEISSISEPESYQNEKSTNESGSYSLAAEKDYNFDNYTENVARSSNIMNKEIDFIHYEDNYLFLFDKKSIDSIDSYVSHIDSIKNYYKKMLENLEQKK